MASVAMETAIAKSCDVYFYDLANDARRGAHLPSFLAPLRLRPASPASTSAARRRASCRRTEWKKARFKSPGDQVWFPGETVIFGIGQGYLIVTPLQLAHMVVDHRVARQELSAAPGEGLSRAGHGQDRAHRAQSWWRSIDVASARALAGRGQRHDPGHDRYGTGAASARQARDYQIAGKTGTAQVFTVAQNQSYNAEDAADRSPARSRAGSSRSRRRRTRRSRWR